MRYKEPYTLVRPDRKKKGSWRYRLGTDPKRSLRSTGKKTKHEANEFCKKLIAKHEDTRQEPTLYEFAKDFFLPNKCEYLLRRIEEGYDFPAETIQHQRGILVNYILPQFGKLLLKEIKANDFEKWRRSIKKLDGTEMANATKNHIRFILKLILDEAVRAELISSNPIMKTKQVNKNIYKARDILTAKEIDKLFPHDYEQSLQIWTRIDYVALFYIMLTTGIRAGEVRALRWGKVRWEEGGLIIDSSAKRKHNIIGLPKNKRTRVVLLDERSIYYLKEWRKVSCKVEAEDFIFQSFKKGTPISSEAILKNFKRALERTGINVEGAKNLVAHSLRHTYNSLMAKVLPAEILKKMTGHLSDEMFERYNHPSPDDMLASLKNYRNQVIQTFSK